MRTRSSATLLALCLASALASAAAAETPSAVEKLDSKAAHAVIETGGLVFLDVYADW